MDTGLLILYFIVGFFALIGLCCFVFFMIFVTECIKDAVEQGNEGAITMPKNLDNIDH